MMLEFSLLLLIFAIQWLAFFPACYFKTERFYDLIGSFTYILIMLIVFFASNASYWRPKLLALLIMIWSVRLGVFLFFRVCAAGGDSRFERIKTSPMQFFKAWTLQGVWITFTAAAAILAITSSHIIVDFDLISAVGLILWIAGFSLEVVADWQKSRFRKNPANANRFIDTGLWSFCRHPNYMGEIMLWLGIALIAFPVLEGWRLIGSVSPFFVALLLVKGSGIPLLERTAEARWGDSEDYKRYKASTPRLFPGF